MSMEQDARMQAIMDGIKTRMAERQAAIGRHSHRDERVADQDVVEDLRNAAAACPSQHPGPEAKQKLEATATQYERSKSREERDHIILNLATKVLSRNGAQLLYAAAGLGIVALAPAASMVVDGVEPVDGHTIDNDDGTHKFLYDTNGDWIPDHEVLVDDETDEQISEPESMGLDEIVGNLLDAVGNIFS